MKKYLYLILVLLIPLLGFVGCTDVVSDEQLAKEVVKNYIMDLYTVTQNDDFFELSRTSTTMTAEEHAKELEEYLSTFKEYFTDKSYLTFIMNRAIVPYRHEDMTVKLNNIEYQDIKFDEEKNSFTIDCKISFDATVINKDKATELHDRRIIRLIKEAGNWKIVSEKVFYDQKLIDVKFGDL